MKWFFLLFLLIAGPVFADPYLGGHLSSISACPNGTLNTGSIDLAGSITFSGTNTTGCTVFFGGDFGGVTPFCLCSKSGVKTTANIPTCDASPTSVIISPLSQFSAADVITYHCQVGGLP